MHYSGNVSSVPDIFPEEYPLIILDKHFAVYMDNNCKDANHTRHIFRRVNFVTNGEQC